MTFELLLQIDTSDTHFFFFLFFLEVGGQTIRTTHRGYSVKKGVLKNFPKFTGKHLCQSLFNKVANPGMQL